MIVIVRSGLDVGRDEATPCREGDELLGVTEGSWMSSLMAEGRRLDVGHGRRPQFEGTVGAEGGGVSS